MYLNIITPCIHIENLVEISKSINIPRENYRWIVVFDLDYQEVNPPDNCEYYFYKNPNPIEGSASRGDAQRNLATDMVTNGHVYYNDDDTIIHPELWDNIKNLDNDFISFDQEWNNGWFRLNGSEIGICKTDTHNFISSRELIGDTRWRLDVYESDGFFVEECYHKAKNPIYIPKVLSTFNKLDKTRIIF
jgi:hypothetical protein